jgi:hypothetical protein
MSGLTKLNVPSMPSSADKKTVSKEVNKADAERLKWRGA